MARSHAGRPLAAALLTLLVIGGATLLWIAPASPVRSRAAVARLPAPALAFEPSPDGERYLVRGARYELAVGADGSVLRGAAGSIHTQLLGARTARALPSQRRPLVVNRYDGPRRHWRTGIPTFGRVTYRDVYAGIDLAYHGRGASLEYDFVVAPGADPRRIALALRGADHVELDRRGDLVAAVAGTRLRQRRPVAFQQIGAVRRAVDARFALSGDRVRFTLGRYDHSRPLVIDPTLTYSDYIGGSRDDAAVRIALDSTGNAYVVGQSSSTSIAGTSATRSGTDYDAFVMKIAPDHTRQWIAYLGGSGADYGTDIGLDAQGRPYIVGSTTSSDFPDANPSVGLYGPQDSFTAALGSDGTLRWATTWGTGDTNSVPLVSYGNAIAVEGDGVSYTAVTGQGGGTTTYAQLVEFDAVGNVVANVFPTALVDGKSTISGVGIKPGCSSSCQLFFGGHLTGSVDCPPPTGTVSIQKAYVGSYNFATSSYAWGAGNYAVYFEDCVGGADVAALDVSHAGDPVIIGTDTPPGTTTVKPHALLARFNGATGAFDPWPIGFSTQVTSAGIDVTHDGDDNIILTGADSALTGDLNGAIQSTYNGGLYDGSVFKIDPAGPADGSGHQNAKIVFGTLFGGSATELVSGVAAASDGSIFFVGATNSPTKFPTQGATQSPGISGSFGDGFIATIRPNRPTITAGPSGTVGSRDAKFAFSADPEAGFAYSAEEAGATFQCKLSPRDPGFGPCPADGYTGLTDGGYTFEVRAFDAAGTLGGTASRDFAVDTTFRPTFTIAPNPALTGATVNFDASASSTAAHSIRKYEWDLDGDGSFETNSAATPTVTQIYPSPGTFNVGLRVTDQDGATAVASNTLKVNALGGVGTQFGVTINSGAQFTNDPNVTVTSTFPSFTSGLLISNDGGFGKAQTFPAKKETKWKLDSSGPERLPKTIYVRFLAGSIAGETHQDDIILDETPPKLTAAEVAPAAAAGAAGTAALRRYTVRTKASDRTSGVGFLQATANKRRPGKAVRYRKKLVVKAANRPRWVRVRDRAGNWSRWRRAR